MTITITTCGECPFCKYDILFYGNYCKHPELANDEQEWVFDDTKILKSCPESGPFTIITKPKNTEDES